MPLDDNDADTNANESDLEDDEPKEPKDTTEPKPQEVPRLSTQEVDQITSAMKRLICAIHRYLVLCPDERCSLDLPAPPWAQGLDSGVILARAEALLRDRAGRPS